MRQMLGTVLVILVIAGMASPFIHDAWAWYHIRSSYAMDDTEKAAYATWSGTPESFVVMLRGRCKATHPDDPQVCLQYAAL